MPPVARLALLLAGWLVACAPHRQPVPPPPARAAADVAQETKLDNGFLTVRVEVPPAPAGPKPVVVSPLGERDALRSAGAVVITYEANWQLLEPFKAGQPPPKNTVGVWLLASPTPKTIGKGFFNLIDYYANTAIPKVLDYVTTLPEVDPTRIGIAGSSTYGFIALQAVAADRRLAAAAAVLACGDYRTFLHYSNLAMNGQPLDLDEGYARWIDAQDPALHPERLVHAAVLMINGTADQAIPIRCVRNTGRVLRRAYARAGVPERFRLRILNGVAHVQNEETRHEVLAWWDRWLLRPSK
ncbi:MAG: hypothetical protein E6J55_14665 [Deltaproteobacteria bacterium]|nr:MAG: hypothetical protein E6J55_14665 [Deltaproteobacteria bacterium]